MTQDEAYRKFKDKQKALMAAAEQVKSILGLSTAPSGDAVCFYRPHDLAIPVAGLAAQEARRLMVLVNQHEKGGTLYCDASDLIPTDDHWYNEMAPWKAAVLEELRLILKLDEEESGYWDNAVAVFRGEIMHPAVLNALS